MRKVVVITLVILAWGCSPRGPLAIFKKLSPHNAYAQHLADAGLNQTALGKLWNQQAQSALASPVAIELPYQETGYFPADKTIALAFSFQLKRGQKLKLVLQKRPAVIMIYADLFSENELIASADSTGLVYEAKKTGDYILRLQPELLISGEYTLQLTTGPALHFPVSASGHPKIEGFWGEGGDDNSRKHEGIDIFAPKGTPALAAADGTVTNVGENKLGGLVVLMQPQGADYMLYYAHLGLQLVRNGQQVRAGDTVGLIDNTGNAKTTPSHLHFGIYTNGGAIDPLVFVQPENQIPPPVTADPGRLDTEVCVNQVPGRIIAAIKNEYKVIMPEQQIAVVPAKSVKPLENNPLTIHYSVVVYDLADTTAPRTTRLAPGEKVNIRGVYRGFAYISYKNYSGWILR